MGSLQYCLKITWLVPAAVVLICAIYIVYPGGFTPDAHLLYAQATGQAELSNAKPFFAVLVMRAGVKLFGDGGFVIINSLVYFLGAALIASALFSRWTAKAMGLLLLVMFPPLLLINLTNWIDALENSTLAVCIGLILHYLFRRPSASLLAGALVFSLWAMFSRHNAPSTVFFLQAFIVLLWSKRYYRTPPRRFVTAALIGLIFVSSLALNVVIGRFLDVKKVRLDGYLYVSDLVGLSVLHDKNFLPPGLMRAAYRSKSDEEILAALRERYTPSHNWKLWDVVSTDETRQYADYALRTLQGYPRSVLFMRYQTNKVLLTETVNAYTVRTGPPVRHAELGIVSNKGRRGLNTFSSLAGAAVDQTPFFKAGWYLLWLLLLLVAAVYYRVSSPRPRVFDGEASIVLALGLAGIFTWLPLAPIIVAAEFRYLMPAVLCSMVNFLVVLRALSVCAASRQASGGRVLSARGQSCVESIGRA